MARRGRPKGVDSAETRLRILDAARTEFAARGFDGASIAVIAAAAELAPSAVYHYFGGKAALYENVFDITAEAIWDEVDAYAAGGVTLQANIESIVRHASELQRLRPGHSEFLALVPMETSLHPEFAHLLDRRSKRQDATFEKLAQTGLTSGELDGFDLEGATELLRSLFMGWFVETHFSNQPASRATGKSLITLVRLLGDR